MFIYKFIVNIISNLLKCKYKFSIFAMLPQREVYAYLINGQNAFCFYILLGMQSLILIKILN
jgi:hypothetical protein